jgi:2-haloacid dehalogenase
MPFESIRLITFDCYGTLIDWENGMLAALRPLLSRVGRKVPDTQILELYGEIEAELESGSYLPYRQVLAQSAQEIGRRLAVEISTEDGRAFAAHSLESFYRHDWRIAIAGQALPPWHHL